MGEVRWLSLACLLAACEAQLSNAGQATVHVGEVLKQIPRFTIREH